LSYHPEFFAKPLISTLPKGCTAAFMTNSSRGVVMSSPLIPKNIYEVVLILCLVIILFLVFRPKQTIIQSQSYYPQKRTLQWLGILFIVFVIVVICCALVSGYFILKRKLIKENNLKQEIAHMVITEDFTYDTNPENDEFIKGALTKEQLKKFDDLLNLEQQKGGMRFKRSDLNELGILDKALIGAYGRWCHCNMLNRYSGHVVYPNMRQAYVNKIN
jgi:hypothetical protein